MDDDRFVARRGAQGDDWRWAEGQTPEPGSRPGQQPNPPPRSRLSGLLRILAARAGRAWRWAASLPAGALAAWRRRRAERQTAIPEPPRPKAGATPPDTAAPPAELKPPSGAPQRLADTKPATTYQPPAPPPLPGSVAWSREAPRPEPVTRPRVAAPWSRIAGARPRLGLPKPSQIPEEIRSPLVLFAALGLAAAIAIGVVLIVSSLGGDSNGGIVGGVTETPVSPTLIPPVSSTPFPTATATPTGTPSPTATPTPTPVPTPTPIPTQNSAQGAVAVALWADSANAWWFGTLKGDVASYQEGQDVPLMVQWQGAQDQTYVATITYDCAVGTTAAGVDYLSGVQDWGRGVIYAQPGPAQDRPDGAITVPDTPSFIADDQDNGLFTAYGAKFSVLPAAPSPGGICPGQRTISLTVQAFGGTVTLLASGHLGSASSYGAGHGSSSATGAISIKVSVAGIGETTVAIEPSAIHG